MSKQRNCFYSYFLFFVFFFLFQSHLVAQSITKSYVFPKFEIYQFEDNDKKVRFLTFDNAINTQEFPTLPAFWDKIEVDNLYASYHYTLLNTKYQPLTSEEMAFIPADYTYNEPKVTLKTATDKKFFAMLTIVPLVKNSSGQYQRLVSCDIRFEGTDPIQTPKAAGLRNSVLATGTWYKIAVNNTGLHKVTYNDLKNLGVPVANLRSSSIALFGNGGGMLSDVNPVVQMDDLMESPIMIKDNGNGGFDENSYFVFYAKGPHSWNFNGSKYNHKYNIYSDSAYYFINVDVGIGEKKRIETKDFSNQTENGTVSYFTHYVFYEKDEKNFGESGRDWFEEPIYASSSKTYNFTLPELYNENVRVKIRAASTSTASSKLELLWGSNSREFDLSIAQSGYFAATREIENTLPFSSGNLPLTLKYNASQSSASVYLDYIEIQAQCKLKITGNQMPFAIAENLGTDNISSVTLDNATEKILIWDVTDHNDVYAVKKILSGTQLSFKTPTNKPRLFITFNDTEYYAVTTVGKINNQNLHGLRNVNMIIVTHPDFESEARRLAKFRAETNQIKVEVVTTQQVYHEFSSGAQDIAAIRNFMRYLYDNDSQQLQYLLLFGRPSYDYRGRMAGTRNFVPNYQSATLLHEDTFRAGDDFFGVLGIGGGNLNGDLLTIAVGRFPVTSLAQAKIVVDKTINASLKRKVALQNASQISNFGDWRNVITFVADDEDGMEHIGTAETSAIKVATKYPTFNLEKIYCDAYPAVSFAGGKRFPDVNKAINLRMERGTLVIAYFGHGGGNGWSHERILETKDITNWKNIFNQPLIITLTCSFGWYDRPPPSPAEKAFLNPNGGASSLLTTSRVSYSNYGLGRNLFEEIGSKQNNRYKTVGEIHKNAKNNASGTNTSTNMIYLIGDPAMIINVPNFNIITDEILGDDLLKIDTLKALAKVTVKGRVTDDNGNILSHFNGNIFPSIFDKKISQKRLTPIPDNCHFCTEDFEIQKNVIFKGNATVKNGQFEFSFFVPKDINFEFGKGKISYYAASENDDAGDYYDSFIIGGMSDKPITDNKGPEIEIYMNDDKFVPGGITNQNPMLFLKLKDEYGINTTGNGIGHDLVAILDNAIEKQMILNDYYMSDQDSYNSGTVRFPLQDLTPGTHTVKVRAWDIFNNPSEASLDFVVKSDEKLELERVLNYPNPFTTKTAFYFEHNQPMETFDILVHIYTVSGKLVRTLSETQFLEGNRSNGIIWDGRDDFGDKIGRGVYLYRLTVRNSLGDTARKIEKIAIL